MSTNPHDHTATSSLLDVTDPAGVSLDDLHAMLRSGVRGVPAEELAVELLINHDHWLYRRDFLTRCVVIADRWLDWDVPPMAVIDWNAVVEAIAPGRSLQPGEGLTGSSSEIAVLTVAAGLAGKPSPHSLRELLAPLDSTTGRVVREVFELAISGEAKR
ncbi:MAG: hypothetical protein GEU83_19205 [Pseudonocardiaceae bacterium]|nr:hypothetical protein [Pseudonocardiaceae bacterium]